MCMSTWYRFKTESYACYYDYMHTLLLYNIYKPPQWGETAVYSASAKGHSDVVKLLVQAGADLELQHKVHK